jgi:hypothetical protein
MSSHNSCIILTTANIHRPTTWTDRNIENKIAGLV